jgi:hypothetical protein
MVLITILTLAVLGFVGKLIYDVQQKKNKPTKSEPDFEYKDDFQKLAGIKPTNPNDELRQILVKNNIIGKQQIIDALLKAAENSEFPKQDESINMGTTKIGTIHTNFGDSDPLATIPMSRVSVEGKKKMAQIAKEDIKVTTEAKANELISKGLVTIQKETKPKKKSNPKQMDGTKSDAPFVKTKKKSTKPKA